MDFRALILGLLIGWLVEWVIDWYYWRRRTSDSSAELNSLRAQNNRLRADLDATSRSVNQLKAEIGVPNGELASAQAENARLRAELDAANSSIGQHKTELDALHAKLDLATAANEAAQARLADAGSAAAQVAGAQDDRFKTQRFTLSDIGAASAAAPGADHSGLQAELAGAHTEIERLRSELDGLRRTQRRDPLIDINGIGPVIEKRMFEAGIFTFEQIAQATPQRLREIAQLKDWQEANPEEWIAEARKRAQDLQSGS